MFDLLQSEEALRYRWYWPRILGVVFFLAALAGLVFGLRNGLYWAFLVVANFFNMLNYKMYLRPKQEHTQLRLTRDSQP
jgi:hypothetical protein